MKKRETDPAKRRLLVVPLRRVFPWWYLGGTVVTLALLVLLVPDGNVGVGGLGGLWGPMIGMTIREREQDARRRLGEGLPTDRSALTDPGWLEPTVAGLWTGASLGIGLLLDAVFSDGTVALTWLAVGLLLGTAAVFVGLLAVLRTQRDRRRRREAPQDC